MSEPTQGPWRVDRRAHTRVVAGIDDTIATTGCQSDLSDQWEANARLIAAAPEMLALLRDLYDHGYTTSHDHDRVAAMITKAEGQ